MDVTAFVETHAEFEADMKADTDLYDAVSDDCFRKFDRKLNEAGLT